MQILRTSLLVGLAMFTTGASAHAQNAAQTKELAQARAHWEAREFDKALTLYKQIIGPKLSPRQFLLPEEEQGWGYSNVTIRKEKAMLLEEIASAARPEKRLKKWSDAVQEWIMISKTFTPRLQPFDLNPAIQAKRAFYFELYFEQKRCSVEAFNALGIQATKGNVGELNDKFAMFAKDFHRLQSQSKNPDLPKDLAKQIKEMVDSVPEVREAYEKLEKP